MVFNVVHTGDTVRAGVFLVSGQRGCHRGAAAKNYDKEILHLFMLSVSSLYKRAFSEIGTEHYK